MSARVRGAVVVGAALGAGGLLATGCAEADPAKYEVDVVFPSVAMAIATEDVRLTVFDDPSPGACQRIYLKRITNQSDLPPIATQTAPIPICEIAFGKKPSLELPTGKRYAILAVALRNNEDLLVGCADVAVSSDDGTASVYVDLPGTAPVPPISACQSFEDVCYNRCQ